MGLPTPEKAAGKLVVFLAGFLVVHLLVAKMLTRNPDLETGFFVIHTVLIYTIPAAAKTARFTAIFTS